MNYTFVSNFCEAYGYLLALGFACMLLSDLFTKVLLVPAAKWGRSRDD